MFDHISEHPRVRQKLSTARRIFNSPLGVWKFSPTQSFVFDILLIFFHVRRWSFGILLWETFTLGGTPYPGLPTEQLLDYLSDGKRMENPAKCPLEVYTIMRDCWIHEPDQRPHFTTLNERLGKILERNMTTVQGYFLSPFNVVRLS